METPVFVTVTLTEVDVRVLPLVSRATAAQRVRPVQLAAGVPRELVRRGHVLRADVDAVDPELHSGDGDVVGRVRADGRRRRKAIAPAVGAVIDTVGCVVSTVTVALAWLEAGPTLPADPPRVTL